MADEEQRKTDGGIVRPVLEWLDGDVPKATGFDDTYFSRAGGLEETRHVFLKGNGLPDRFEERDSFTIAELGFGTGLNFLTTLFALKNVPAPPKLTFISFELFPMPKEELARALAAFPDLSEEALALTNNWAPDPGWNLVELKGADLLLGIGDARQLIDHLKSSCLDVKDGRIARVDPVDAWYLDGFSPAKNPELWDVELLRSAAGITAENGTLATYTAAGWVRRNLQAAGFVIEKVKGFAGKREMVIGHLA